MSVDRSHPTDDGQQGAAGPAQPAVAQHRQPAPVLPTGELAEAQAAPILGSLGAAALASSLSPEEQATERNTIDLFAYWGFPPPRASRRSRPR
jgi:hypothetical protein